MRKRDKAFVVACIAVAAACGAEREPSPSPVKIGVLFPMSGALAEKGRDSANGVALAVEEINAAGGIASLGGALIVPVFADSRGQGDVGASEAERLIAHERAVALVGTYQSSVTKVATQVAERMETPFLVSISLADIIIERGFRYTFRIQPKVDYYCRDELAFVRDLEKRTGRPMRRVALIHENTDFGTSTALAQKRALRENGFELVARVAYTAEGATDLRGQVDEVLAARPDVILETTYFEDSVLIRRALVEAGSSVPLIDLAGGTVSPAYVVQLGAAAEGTFTLTEFSKYAGGGKELNDRFRARFGDDITGDSAYAYQAVWVLADALERAGTVDREAVRDALAATDLVRGPHMVLPSERVRFGPDGQNDSARLFVAQIQGGALLPVWPSEYAVATPVLEGGEAR